MTDLYGFKKQIDNNPNSPTYRQERWVRDTTHDTACNSENTSWWIETNDKVCVEISATIRKSYNSLAEANADKTLIDPETKEKLKIGQLISVVADPNVDNNAIYRLASIATDGTPTWERQASLGDMLQYTKSGGSTKTAKDLENEIVQLVDDLDDRIVELELHKNPMVVMTQNEYDALEIKDPDTYYLIMED